MCVYIYIYIPNTTHAPRMFIAICCDIPITVLTVPRPSFTYSTTFVLHRRRRLRLYTRDTAVSCDRSKRSITRELRVKSHDKPPRRATAVVACLCGIRQSHAAPADNLYTRALVRNVLVRGVKTNRIIVGSLSDSARGVAGRMAFLEHADFEYARVAINCRLSTFAQEPVNTRPFFVKNTNSSVVHNCSRCYDDR